MWIWCLRTIKKKKNKVWTQYTGKIQSSSPLDILNVFWWIGTRASLVAQWLRMHLHCWRHRRCGFDPWVGKISWRRAWQPTPIFLPRKSLGQRRLVAYSPWGHRVRCDWNDRVCTQEWIWTWVEWSILYCCFIIK